MRCYEKKIADAPLENSAANQHFPSPAQLPDRLISITDELVTTGTDRPIFVQDGESPTRTHVINPFRMDPCAVTNMWFEQFVNATGYRTDAERFGSSLVICDMISPLIKVSQGVVGSPWWRDVEGANWREPEGPGTTIENRTDHPVVHVSWNDATEFSRWAGGRLPSEIEWERAAQGGQGPVRYPWGDEEPRLAENGHYNLCNIGWGEFAPDASRARKSPATCAVSDYQANPEGFYNMAGNVWEWCGDQYLDNSEYDFSVPNFAASDGSSVRIAKGGSYLCHKTYCWRYRIAARHFTTRDTSTGHLGFRLAAEIS